MLRLDGLSLGGFKSFADRAEMTLPDGISCVVGPNGCGKSNIVDAITWVLGEQRARFLRGQKMEDVIFAGARSRKPAGLAEVSLRFSPRPGIEEKLAANGEPVDSRLVEPMEVTRRLYRNGDSEYLVNGQRVRLKDVNRLLTGTGLTTRAYSIIGQGRVEQILQSKPTDRRVLIEEAAGITGYRAKRKAATVKLEQAERDLLRVTDIIAEIEKQLRSLKRQASAARRYRRHAGRQRIVLRALYAVKHGKLADRLDELERELTELRSQQAASGEALASIEEAAASARERVAELEAGRDALAGRKQEVQLAVERAKSQVAGCRDRLADNAEQVARNERAVKEVRGELDGLVEQRDSHAQRVERLQGELAEAEARLVETGERTETSRRELEATHRLIAETKENIFEVMSESAGVRNRRHEVEETIGRLEGHASRLAEAVGSAEAEAQQVADEAEAGRVRLTEAIQTEDRLKHRLDEALQELQEISEHLDRLARSASEARSELNDAEWQLSAVGESLRSRAAYRESVRRFLQDPTEGVLGTVADFARTVEGHELACEKALGPFLQAIVFESRAAAEVAVRRLAPSQEAEVHFAFPEGEAPVRGRAPEGVLGAIADSLSFPEDKSWLAALVPNGWVVREAHSALAMSKQYPAETFVSLDGALIGPGGQGSAGRPLGEDDGILETKARHEKLEGEVEGLRERATAVENELASVDERRAALVDEQESRREALANAEKETLAARHALEGLREVAERVNARLNSLRYEHRSASEELGDAERRRDELTARLEAAATQREELDATLARAQEAATRLEAATAEADAALSRLREEVAIKRERGEAARAELRPVEARIAQVEERLRLLEDERSALDHQRAQLESSIAQGEESIHTGNEQWEQLRLDLDGAEERVQEERAGLVDGATRLRDLRVEHDSKSRAANEADVKRERVSSQLEHLVDDCVKELGVAPDELERPLPPEAEDELLAEEEAAADEPEAVAEEEPAAEAPEETEVAAEADEETEAEAGLPQDEGEDSSDEEEEIVIDESLPWNEDGELDLAVLEDEAKELRRKIANIGPVNLVAIDEYDELAERHGFLAKERDDLETSIASLRETIEEIDATSRERFVECFEVVREHFDEAFQTLFRGGRAELRLQDEEDVLESGIEIIAQPPGKRLQNMMLLSGGEKALTAIALLFALFRYKPSPFCILDEVDAPLDEANVARFITLVEAMSDETQFLVVTHNRRTMEQGKVLYGVTMEEAGCSKLVSVHFEGLTAAGAA